MNSWVDYLEDGTVLIWINTVDQSFGPVAPSSAFTTSDFAIHKDGSATEKTTTNGITVTSPFDSKTGLHLISIDTSNDTGDSGFWAAGSVYLIRFETSKTVDSVSIDGRAITSFGLDASRLKALPNASADSAGGLPVSDAGGLDLDTKLANTDLITSDRMAVLTDWIDGERLDSLLDSVLEDTGTTLPQTLVTIAEYIDTEVAAIKAKTDQLVFTNANQLDCFVVGIGDDVIQASTFDESTAYPLTSADTGSTQVARTGSDSDTLETLSDQLDGVGGGGGSTNNIETETTVIHTESS